MKKRLLISLLAMAIFTLFVTQINANYNIKYTYSDAPSGYYDMTQEVLADKTLLKSELNRIISQNYIKFSYSNAWNLIEEADEDPNNPDNVLLLYTGKSMGKETHGSSGTASWNREHVWAKSRGFNLESSPAYTDIHHLRATECQTNSSRSNSSFAEISDAWCSANSSTCKTDIYGNKWTSNKFDPRDEVKGDVARILFYMEVRYQGKNSNEPNLKITNQLEGINPPSGTVGNGEIGLLDTLVKWHYEDPVDQRETYRNNVIYNYQKNRNPFIDHPEYVDTLYPNTHVNPEVDQIKVDAIINRINQIGIVSLDKKESIQLIQTDYNLLKTAEKSLVTNYNTLTLALQKIIELENELLNQGMGKILDIDFSIFADKTATYRPIENLSSKENNLSVSQGYTLNEFRLGSNKVVTLEDKYNKYDLAKKDGSVLLVKENLSNMKKISFEFGSDGIYGTISYVGILSSTDKINYTELVNYTALPENKKIEIELDTPINGDIALVIIGTTPRLKLLNLSVFTKSEISEPFLDIINSIHNIELNLINYDAISKTLLDEISFKYNDLEPAKKLLVTNYNKLEKAYNIYYSKSPILTEKRILTTIKYYYYDALNSKIVLNTQEIYSNINSDIDILNDVVIQNIINEGYQYIGLINKNLFITNKTDYSMVTVTDNQEYEVVFSTYENRVLFFLDNSNHIHTIVNTLNNSRLTIEQLNSIKNILYYPNGFEFEKFVIQGVEFNQDTLIDNNLLITFTTIKANQSLYDVTVQNGITTKDKASYDELITVSTNLDNFSHWEDLDKNILSYKKEYRFTVFDNVSLIAVANSDKTEKILYHFYPVDNTKNDLLVIGFYLPIQYELIEVGVVFNGNSFETGTKFVAKNISENNEFAIMKKNFTSYTGFITYKFENEYLTNFFNKTASKEQTTEILFTSDLTGDATSDIKIEDLQAYFSTLMNSGIITSMTALKIYKAPNALKFGSSSAPGKLVINFGQGVNLIKISLNASVFNVEDAGIEVNSTIQYLEKNEKNKDFTFLGLSGNILTVQSVKKGDNRIRLNKITITYSINE